MNTQPKTNRLQKIVSGVTNIPTLPQVLANVNRLLLDPQTTSTQVADAISRDQAMTIKMLKVVNSAYYGFPSKISQVGHAISILGFVTARSLLVTTSVINTMSMIKSSNVTFNVAEYWIHSLAVATAAKLLARELGYVALSEDAFVAGLLHDIGKMVLIQQSQTDYENVLIQAQQKQTSTLIIEEHMLEFTHEDVGGLLAARWDLPQKLVGAISCHHHPIDNEKSRELQVFNSIIHIADALCKMIGLGDTGDDCLAPIDVRVWDLMKIKNSTLNTVMMKLTEKRDEIYDLLNEIKN